MKEILLTKGYKAEVDDSDYEDLNQFKWRWCNGYAIRNISYIDENGRRQQTYERMHRRILNAPPHLEVDHKDGNGLRNLRDNLRLATVQQNQQNMKAIEGTSKYKGVGFFKTKRPQKKQWISTITSPIGKRIYLGLFETQEEAAIAYNTAALLHFGEFARLNIIKDVL